ncbi:putative acetyltransferase [Microbacterium sp. MAHUQ-60]|uniref:putative acetyltransferase n=1 Tax=unclassified Microbacterium TaxID=2609290 RepID=UPI00360D501E
MPDVVRFIRDTPLGTRMTVRKRIPGGFTDAVGYLRACGDQECVVETRRGPVSIRLDEVTAAKVVPPPPPRRAPRYSPLS